MKYAYSTDGEMFHGLCDSKKEAIEEGSADALDDEDIFIGEAIEETIGGYITNYHIESLLESIAENAGEECGEATIGWLSKLPKEELSNLKGQIQAVLEEWATQSGYQPKFYHVENVEQVSIMEGCRNENR